MNTLGQNIRAARKAARLTQKELALQVFVSRETISHYENDRETPPPETMSLIARVLKTTRDELEGTTTLNQAGGVEIDFPGLDENGKQMLSRIWMSITEWKNKGL